MSQGAGTRRLSWRVALYACVAMTVSIVIIPFLWEISTALKPENQLLARPPRLIPFPPTLEHFRHALERGVGRGLLNSLFVAGAASVLTVGIGSLAAYSLARLRFRFSNLVLLLIIAPMMLPGLSNLVPVYVIMSRIQILDTHWVLILLYTVTHLPLGVWILRGFFQSIPHEVEEAATLDGATPVQSLFRIVMPMAQPALAATALFVFTFSWNDFVIAVTMTSSASMRTAQVWLWSTIGDVGTDWGALMAVSVLTNLPVLLVFVALERRFITGLSAGAVRG
jgi:ABC-type glycerol-3-phosphate transport system permease component